MLNPSLADARPRTAAGLIAAGQVALPFAAYLALTLPLRGWLIDDAAISFAYARNWAAGYGLVAQPGTAPVEGYSNFLWVLAFRLFYELGGTDAAAGAKALGATLVLASLISLRATCRMLLPERPLATFVVLLATATSSSIVTWTSSGLENPLFLLLVCELLRRSALWQPASPLRHAAGLGALAAAAAMTRPDGAALAVFPPLALFFAAWQACAGWRGLGRSMAIYLAAFAAIFGAFLCHRFLTFGDLLPNTYYAKVEGGAAPLIQYAYNAYALLNGPFRNPGLTLALLVIAGAMAVLNPLARARLVPPLLLCLICLGIFLILPPDWWPDLRFATGFIPAFFVSVAVAVEALSRTAWARRAILLLLLSAGGIASARNLETFYAEPTVPFDRVTELYGRVFKERAEELGLRDASILLPDVGGMLLTSPLRVYDLAGLCDRTIARTLYHERDRAAFHDYVFERIKPTFIHTHANWDHEAGFDRDPRFRRDYVAITEELDEGYLRANGIAAKRGDYVRRDVLGARDPAILR